MEFVMLMGIPGCGKSTLTEQYRQRGYRVHASDAIRAELYGSEEEQGRASEVFAVLLRRLREDLKAGRSCVMDATNLRRKRRMQTLRELSKFAMQKTCVLALAAPEECERRNQARARRVPEEVMDQMLRAFEAPWYYEGWDAIEAVFTGAPFVFPREQARSLSQDNPFHRLTLGDHLDAVRDFCRAQGSSAAVQEAAWYHDVGKLLTRRFLDSRGQPSESAHFYDHENVGAYLYLCEKADAAFRDGTWEDTLYIANLINWHMRPLNVWSRSPASEEKDRALMGEGMYNDLKRLREADAAGH